MAMNRKDYQPMVKEELDLTAINFYNDVASDFDDPLNQPFYEGIAEQLLALVPPGSVNSILEVGAGCGFATRKIRERFPKAKIVVLEPAPKMFLRAKKRVPEVTWVCQSLREFNLPYQFDLVLASMSYHWLKEKERQKLFALAKSVALAIPITDKNPGSKPASSKAERPVLSEVEGNQILTKLMLCLKTKPKWEKVVRQGRWAVSEFNKHFQRVLETDLKFREEFKTHQSLIRALYSRGVLLALYDGKLEQAKKILFQSSKGEAVFNWNIKLVVGYG